MNDLNRTYFILQRTTILDEELTDFQAYLIESIGTWDAFVEACSNTKFSLFSSTTKIKNPELWVTHKKKVLLR